MKKRLNQGAILVWTLLWINANSQTILIEDTLYNPSFSSSNTSFFIEGYVNGIDSGSLKLTITNEEYSIPIRESKFYIYGYSYAVQQAQYILKDDYYENSFFIEPGKIKIECDTINRIYRARGTKENDIGNYFYDSLAYPLTSEYHNLSRKAEALVESQNIDEYLKTIDSFSVIQYGYISVIEDAINKKLLGFYLLDAINLYPIRNKLFNERKMLFNKLPTYLTNSEKGEDAHAYLKKTETESQQMEYLSPEFLLHDNLGREFNLSKLYYGKKNIVLDFWASWCAPCIKALPMLVKIQQMDLSKDVQFVSISIDKNREDWIKAESRLKIPWISLITDSISAEKYNIKAIPAYFIIDKQGNMKSIGSSIADLYYDIKNALQ